MRVCPSSFSGLALISGLILLSACGEKEPATDDSNSGVPEDLDQDGYPGIEDCDDQDPNVHPEAAELCDGRDQDCDTQVDEGLPSTDYFLDQDGDSHGDPSALLASCAQPEGYVLPGDDCDDADPAVYPGAAEACNAADDDCDTLIDEEEDLQPTDTWYPDLDDDGYGDDDAPLLTCAPPSGYTRTPGDCDDTLPSTAPNQPESCDGRDNDCDDNVDESPANDARTWYQDADGDLFGSPTATEVACKPSEGYVESAEDCDDSDAAVNPAAEEVCGNLADDNCDDAAPDCEWSGALLLSTTAPLRLQGEDTDNSLGFAVQGALTGDHDMDGVVEILVGAPGHDAGTGRAYVLTLSGVSGSVDVASADAYLTGAEEGDAFGSRVSWAGEVAVDSTCVGCTDALVGAYKNDDNGSQAGAVYLFGDTQGNRDTTDAWATWWGTSARDFAGYALAGVGDVTGDGNDDVLIGAYGSDSAGTDAGAVYLIAGKVARGSSDTLDNATVIWTGVDGNDYAGAWVSGGEDINGDGKKDMVVGASRADGTAAASGVAYVILGSSKLSGGALSGADTVVLGTSASDSLGASVELLGDVNDDGYGELVIGAPAQDSAGAGAGAVYIFYSVGTGTFDADTDADLRLLGVSSSDAAGSAVASAGDFNADNRPDLLVGAPSAKGWVSASGVAYLFYAQSLGTGTVSLGDADLILRGTNKQDYAGQALGSGGDINGDGYSEILIGAWAEDSAASGAGAIYIYPGKGR